MNEASPIRADSVVVGGKNATGHTACPHDCPSTCALDVELLSRDRIGRVRGAPDNSYTAGVICAKVARYAERIHHPDRLIKPLVRSGARGGGDWKDASWEAALDLVAEKFIAAEQKYGSETVWPYYYAGTMGLVQRDSINRLRHAKRYSGFFGTICVNPAFAGYEMGTGALRGPDPREMAKSDCVVIWGTNAVATQVNVMTHAIRARKERGAKIVVVDIYDNPTMKQADLAIKLKPSTDGALACGLMHVLFRDGYADRDYLDKYTDDPVGIEAHLQTRTPEWAANITGLSVEEIEAFARLIGENKRTFFRLGYGFTRNRNGSANMHAAASIAAITGAWKYEGGGAFHTNGGIFGIDKSLIEGDAMLDPTIRTLDQSQIGRVLTGDKTALYDGPPVTALLIQNTNPVNVAPEQRLVKQGFLRDDLFTCVHEQFMTETAQLADVVLPATMFMEHDDLYRGGGNQHINLGPKIIDPPEGPRENLYVIDELARRLGVDDKPGFGLTARQHIDYMLEKRGLGTFETFEKERWADVQPDFETSHYLNGFGHPDGKYRFRPDWKSTPMGIRPPDSMGMLGDYAQLPEFPDHVELLESTNPEHPFRLATSPARNFLNSTFTETPGSKKREGGPKLMIHPDDASAHAIADGDRIEIGNPRGEMVILASVTNDTKPGTLIAEGIWPNSAHERGEGINILTGADQIAPYGGAAFHDTRVWLRRLA